MRRAQSLKRRTMLSAIGTAGAMALFAGCTAELSGAASGLTGRVGEPRALDIENDTATAQTVSIRITRDDGTTVFSEQRTVPSETDVEDVWTTTRVGRYTVSARTADCRQASATMFVCVGYHDAKLRIDPDGLLFGQAHGDPEAAACSLDTSS